VMESGIKYIIPLIFGLGIKIMILESWLWSRDQK